MLCVYTIATSVSWHCTQLCMQNFYSSYWGLCTHNSSMAWLIDAHISIDYCTFDDWLLIAYWLRRKAAHLRFWEEMLKIYKWWGQLTCASHQVMNMRMNQSYMLLNSHSIHNPRSIKVDKWMGFLGPHLWIWMPALDRVKTVEAKLETIYLKITWHHLGLCIVSRFGLGYDVEWGGLYASAKVLIQSRSLWLLFPLKKINMPYPIRCFTLLTSNVVLCLTGSYHPTICQFQPFGTIQNTELRFWAKKVLIKKFF